MELSEGMQRRAARTRASAELFRHGLTMLAPVDCTLSPHAGGKRSHQQTELQHGFSERRRAGTVICEDNTEAERLLCTVYTKSGARIAPAVSRLISTPLDASAGVDKIVDAARLKRAPHGLR